MKTLVIFFLLAYASSSHQQRRTKRDHDKGAMHLPRDVTPLHYQLEIQPLIDEQKFQGHVIIKVECQEETDKMTLHADGLLHIESSKILATTVAKAKPIQSQPTEPPTVAPVPVGAARLVPVSSSFVPENAGHDHHDAEHHHHHATPVEDEESNQANVTVKGEPIPVLRIERNLAKQWLVLHMDRHLQRGQQFTIELYFSGLLGAEAENGIYMESYTDLISRETRSYIATQMHDNNARKVFPCFDEPSYKVPMQVTVLALNLYTVLGNMPEESMDQRGDWVGHKFQESPPMATFSVAFAIFNLKLLGFDLSDHGRIQFYGRNELNELPNTAKALYAASQSVEIMKEYLNVALPVPKLDFVVLPGANSFAAANWGLIFLSESYLTCHHCVYQQVTRDVAQQWIGHLITPQWCKGQEMNKALANFLAFTTELKMDNSTTTSSRIWQMNYPLYYEFGKSVRITPAAFSKHPHRAISFELVLRMFNYTLTQQTFRAGIQYLVNQRAYKSYLIDDVWSALTLLAGTEGALPEPGTVNQIAFSWLHVPRIPYVKVTRDYEKFTAEVEQHPFFRDSVNEEADQTDEDFWWIPLVVVAQNNLKFDELKPAKWMEEEARVALQDLPSSSYFIIVNPEEVGPFIVNYDRKNWFLISEYLDRNLNNQQIPAGTRGKLIHDALNLAFGGKLRFDSALNVTRFLIHERDPIVWLPAFNMFDHILRQLEGTKTADKLHEYIKVILTPAYETLVNKTGPYNEAEERMISSGRAALCATGYEPCIAEARRAWKIWMTSSDPDAGIPINLSHFCWVFKFGTQDEWDFGLQRFKNYPAHLKRMDRFYLLKSLVSCPSNSANIDKLLNVTLFNPKEEDGDDSESNVSFLLSSISSDVGYRALFSILDENWNTIKNKYDTKTSHQWEYIVSTATMNFKTQEGLEMVSEMAQQRQGDFGKAGPIIEQALRQIKRHVKWAEDNRIIIDQWLDGYLARRRT